MDWQSAKNYIIALLVIINAMLLFSIIGHNNNASLDNPYFSGETLANFQAILQDKGITLEAELPRTTENTGVVSIEYERIDAETYPALFEAFADIELLDNAKRAAFVIETADAIPRDQYSSKQYDEWLAYFEELLEQYFGNSYRLKYQNKNIWRFNPVIDGKIYEDGYVEFEIKNGTIAVSAVMITPIGESANKRTTITSVEAVINALTELEEGARIIAVDLIYYSDLPEEELHKTRDARAFPMWRILTDDYHTIYISAIKS